MYKGYERTFFATEIHGAKCILLLVFFSLFSSAVDYERVIQNDTMKFEADHEECVRVLPYLNDGEVEIHLYVYGDKSGIPTELEKAAQAFFGQKGWKLIWADLYNDAFNLLQVTSIECSSGEPKRLETSQVDEIEEIINNHLHIFSKHRNVTAVQPSFKITKSVQTEEACIVVYVLGKGRIPMGEKAIPHAIGPYRVDIVNGFCIRTNDPYMPKEAHKQKDFLRLGTSIGVNGKQSSGTLGAIVEDENGALYVLSCDHVMKDAAESEIIHPGLDVYLNGIRFNLNGYKDWIKRITGLDLQLPPISDDSHEETELKKIFDDLKAKKEMHVDLYGCSNSVKEQITIYESNLEEAFGRRPRVIASYSAGVRCNVRSEMYRREHFIDAAVSKLNDDEERNLIAEEVLQIIDTTHYPSGMCIPATTNETMDVEELFKSGSTTGFTESSIILGSSQRLPTYIRDSVRPNGNCAWIDVDCINCKKRRTAQSQVQEPLDPCEQCQEDRWLKRCLCIQQHGRNPFSDKGDSGAVVFEKRRQDNRNEYQLPSRGFGIIFAELSTGYFNFAIASPLEIALEALSQRVSESRPNGEPCQLRLASSFR